MKLIINKIIIFKFVKRKSTERNVIKKLVQRADTLGPILGADFFLSDYIDEIIQIILYNNYILVVEGFELNVTN